MGGQMPEIPALNKAAARGRMSIQFERRIFESGVKNEKRVLSHGRGGEAR
jgi:hypothetical protein